MNTTPCRWNYDEFCTNADCPVRADYCPVPDTPDVCRYEDRPPQWTAQDIADAKAIMRLIPTARIVSRNNKNVLSLLNGARWLITSELDKKLFASLKEKQEIPLQEIIESEKGASQNG